MAEKGKLPLVLLIALVVLSLAALGGTAFLLQKEKVRSVELESKLEDLNTKQRITETKFEEAKKIMAELQTKLQDARAEIETLNKDLQQEKADKAQAQSKLEQIIADLDQQKTMRMDLEKKLAQAEQEAVKMQVQLKQLESQKNDLEKRIKNLETKAEEEGVELGTIVVNPEAKAAAVVPAVAEKPVKKEKARTDAKPQEKAAPKAQKAGLEAKVLVVNKDYNFVVLNLGSKDGVKIGDEFALFHGEQNIGSVKVEKLHDSMAAAGFVNQDAKEKVSEGDRAVQKK